MPNLGEVRKASEIGYKSEYHYIWQACEDCGKERWVQLRHGMPERLRCRSCSRRGNKNGWKGGRFKDANGYIRIYLEPNDFFYSMANSDHYIYEHRLVMAKALGRCLQPWEIVHHKKGYAKDDNRYPKTLQLVSDERHNQITILENRIRHLEQRITLLEAENTRIEMNAQLVGIKRVGRSRQ